MRSLHCITVGGPARHHVLHLRARHGECEQPLGRRALLGRQASQRQGPARQGMCCLAVGRLCKRATAAPALLPEHASHLYAQAALVVVHSHVAASGLQPAVGHELEYEGTTQSSDTCTASMPPLRSQLRRACTKRSAHQQQTNHAATPHLECVRPPRHHIDVENQV